MPPPEQARVFALMKHALEPLPSNLADGSSSVLDSGSGPNTLDEVNAAILHDTSDHCGPEWLHRTLQMTHGYSSPTQPMAPHHHCVDCAVANARHKGLNNTVHSMLHLSEAPLTLDDEGLAVMSRNSSQAKRP